MDKEDFSRRTVIALLAAAGVGIVARNLDSPSGELPANMGEKQPPGEDPQADTSADTGTPEKVEREVQLEDHGGVADGTTDDTDALMSALNAAAPAGTVHLPSGDILIGSDMSDALLLEHRHRGVTIAGTSPFQTQLKMAAGHNSVHRGIVISPSNKDDLTGITIRDLTLNGQGLKQKFNIANGIEILDAGGAGFPVEIRNCAIRDWATNGLQIREPGTRIHNCSIFRNGLKQEQTTGRDGHGVAAFITSNQNQETLIQGSLLAENTGAGADNKGGNMTIRDCVIDECGYGVKQNDTTNVQVIENTRISNLQTEPGVYNIPQDRTGGDLILNNVFFENATDPAILFPAGGSISGDRIVIRHTNTEASQPAAIVVKDEGREFDLDELAIYGTGSGTALHLENCTGSIEQLVHDGNPEGVGPLSDVDVDNIRKDDSVTVDVPESSDVGASGYY